MREASTVACNERIISAICAMVMAAAPSVATGATGLERLLLMKLSESQNAANNTYFSYDRFSDQSEKLRETLQETQEHCEPPKKPATPPETTAFPADNQTSERTQLHRTNYA